MIVGTKLIEVGTRRGGITYTEEMLRKFWEDLPDVPLLTGIPLIRASDQKQIGTIRNFHYIPLGGKTPGGTITVEAHINDPDILAQPWLNFEQVARAATFFSVGLKP